MNLASALLAFRSVGRGALLAIFTGIVACQMTATRPAEEPSSVRRPPAITVVSVDGELPQADPGLVSELRGLWRSATSASESLHVLRATIRLVESQTHPCQALHDALGALNTVAYRMLADRSRGKCNLPESVEAAGISEDAVQAVRRRFADSRPSMDALVRFVDSEEYDAATRMAAIDELALRSNLVECRSCIDALLHACVVGSVEVRARALWTVGKHVRQPGAYGRERFEEIAVRTLAQPELALASLQALSLVRELSEFSVAAVREKMNARECFVALLATELAIRHGDDRQGHLQLLGVGLSSPWGIRIANTLAEGDGSRILLSGLVSPDAYAAAQLRLALTTEDWSLPAEPLAPFLASTVVGEQTFRAIQRLGPRQYGRVDDPSFLLMMLKLADCLAGSRDRRSGEERECEISTVSRTATWSEFNRVTGLFDLTVSQERVERDKVHEESGRDWTGFLEDPEWGDVALAMTVLGEGNSRERNRVLKEAVSSGRWRILSAVLMSSAPGSDKRRRWSEHVLRERLAQTYDELEWTALALWLARYRDDTELMQRWLRSDDERERRLALDALTF